MAHRSQCSSAGDNPLDPNYLPPHYREEYRLAIDALVEADLEGYYGFLQEADVVDFLSHSEIEYIKHIVQVPHHATQPERRYMAEDVDGSSDTYWPVHSDHDAPSLDLGWPQQYRFVGPTEVTTLVNPSVPEMPSIKEQVRRMIKNAQQVIAVVMDMFTDVDIFADILGAAARGVAVYVLLDELNAHHFVAMVNNCRVNLDELKFMRVRTVSGSTYYCRTGKTFKGQMMDRFILVDCRAVLSGNYSFMWSFEKIHRCLAHLFLGQLVTTFDEEFRILYAHSEPLVVENVLANMPHYSGEPESDYNTEKTHMFNRQYPTMGMEWAGRTTEDHLKLGYKMLPFRSESIHSATEANPPIPRHMTLSAAHQYRGDHQFIEHERQIRGPNKTLGFKRHSYGNIPDYEYMPPQNHPTIRVNQYMEGAVPQGGHFAREPHIYQGAGLQSGYDMYGRFRDQDQHIDQLSGPVYPHEGDDAETPGAYDHIQRYLQSQTAMEEEHGPRNELPHMQSNLKRHSMGHSYTCQTSPTQPNPPEYKRFLNVNRKPQDASQKQGLRDWRISSYLSANDDAGELDLAELEGSTAFDDIPCFPQEALCGPILGEIRPGNREFNRIPSPREKPTFVQIQNDSIVPDSLVNPPSDLSQINIKTTPASTSESSCTTEGDKAEETQKREPKETNRINEEFLKRKPNRPVQRSSRLRHSLIFSSNLELHTSEEMKDTAGEKDGDEASKLSARVTQMLDKRRTGSPFQPFQWSNFVKSATFDNSTSESAQPLNKMVENSDVDKVETCQNIQKNSLKGNLQEKGLPQTVPEKNSQRDGCPSNLLQKQSSFIDMNDPDYRLRYFKELAAKRKLAAAKASQSNPMKATQKFNLPEKPLATDADKKEPVFKTPETSLKSKNTPAAVTEIKETYKDIRCEESSKDILHRATDAEKIRFKKKLAEESGSTLKNFKGDIDQALKSVEGVRTVTNQTPPILKIVSQKPLCVLENQVESVALDTISKESGLTQYHIPKETDPSHAFLTESCLPVKLPQTKCVSPLSTTPNEGSLSAKDSQILAQSLPKISSTCPDTLSLDSNSVANLAIVDTGVASKNDHKDTVPSPAISTTGISSTEHPTAMKADSSQHLKETGADFSRHFTAVGSEPSTAENMHSQHHSATEENSSQQHTPMEADSSIPPNTTECESLQNVSSTEADHSQHTPASKTDCFQQPTGVRKELSLHPISAECRTSQNVPITKETDCFQQPTAAEIETSYNFTTIKSASSQQPTETGEDSSQSPIKTRTDYCKRSSGAESEDSEKHTAVQIGPTTARNKSSQQYSAVSSDFSKHPREVGADTSEHHTAPEKDYSQMSAASVEDSMQNRVAKESKHSLKPTASGTQHCMQLNDSAATSSKHSSAMEIDSSQQPTVTATDSCQQPIAKEIDSSQKPIGMETDSSQQSTASMVDTIKEFSASEADTPQYHTSTKSDLSTEPFKQLPLLGAGASQQPIATTTASTQQSTITISDSSQQHTATVTDSSPEPTLKVTDSSQQPTVTEIGSSRKPSAADKNCSQKSTSIGTDSSDKDSSQQPFVMVTDSSDTDCSQQPTATVTDSSDTDCPQQPTATVIDSSDTDCSQQPTGIITDSSDTDSSQQPIITVTDSSDTDCSQQPTAMVIDSSDTDSSQQPTGIITDSSDTDSSQQPIITVTDSSDTDCSQQPTATVTDSSDTDSSQQPIVTVTDSSDIDCSQQPIITVTDSSDTDCSQQPTGIITDSSDTDSSQQPTGIITDSSDTDSSQQPIITVTDSSDTDCSKQPTATVTDSSDTDCSQQPTATVTDSSDTESSQQPTVTVTDCSQQPTATVTDSSQQPAATETCSSKKLAAADKDSSQKSTSTGTNSSDTDCCKQPTATVTDSSDTDSFQQPTSAVTNSSDTDSSQQPTAAKIDSSRETTAADTDSSDTDSSQQPTPTEIGSSKMSAAADKDSSQQPTGPVKDSSDTDSFQQATITVTDSSGTDSSQLPTATFTGSSDTDSFQQPTATEVDSSQESTAKDTNSSQMFTAAETDSLPEATSTVTDSSQQPSATETDYSPEATITVPDSSGTDSSQLPTATVTDSFQQPTAAYTYSSQKLTSAGTYSSQQPSATEVDSSQKSTAKDTNSFQQPIATEVDSSQESTAKDTNSSQMSTAAETDSAPEATSTVTYSSQQPSATETDYSSEPTATVTDSSQHSTVKDTDSSNTVSSQQPTAADTNSSQNSTSAGTDSSHQPIATEVDYSQESTAKDTDSSQQPIATEVDSSPEPTAADTDSSQISTAAETDSAPEATAAVTYSSQHSTITDTDSSQQPTVRVTDSSDTDSSQQPAATTTDCFQQSFATETDSSQQPAAKETDYSQTHTVTATDSFQLFIPTETDLSQQITITESEFSPNPTKMETDTSKHLIKTENESLQDISATKLDCVNAKKDNLSEDFSKLIPVLKANITQKDNSICQNAVITDLSSPAEHSQSDTITLCDSQVELNQTKACVIYTVKDTDNGASTSLDSMELSSTQTQGSPEPCLSSDEINSTQGIPQLQSSLSSKPEKTDESQKSDTITPQTHDTSAIDTHRVDKIKQTAPEVENTVTKIAEVSEKSDLTVHSNLENQSFVAENAKSIKSAHQTSTANVISCSNLRDDTKVLLEQISAKNQSRSSLSKQTLTAPNEAKKPVVSSADKLLSSCSGRPWSSKTTTEEREMLLQKMAQMRKERKVYSRFEAS
ncbi:serine-rich adhesin for platelets isoform X2 [Carassius gibelio]|uniref:serine-rich adhesin for platelets isoform X2 n=1 Tax=Carassius gibelio TaxID=101364 RepID=UPI002279BAD7|nr:serine-rich adhesin for platelets isoform X2 [Carassius gibelio]